MISACFLFYILFCLIIPGVWWLLCFWFSLVLLEPCASSAAGVICLFVHYQELHSVVSVDLDVTIRPQDFFLQTRLDFSSIFRQLLRSIVSPTCWHIFLKRMCNQFFPFFLNFFWEHRNWIETVTVQHVWLWSIQYFSEAFRYSRSWQTLNQGKQLNQLSRMVFYFDPSLVLQPIFVSYNKSQPANYIFSLFSETHDLSHAFCFMCFQFDVTLAHFGGRKLYFI